MATRPSYQARRNELARAAGWKSYSEQRSASERGYSTAAEYRLARGGRRERPPARATRTLRTGTKVTRFGNRQNYTASTSSPPQMADVAGALRRAGERGDRAQVFVDGVAVGGGHGWTASYLLDVLDQYDSFADFLDEYGYGDDVETGGVVSVTLG